MPVKLGPRAQFIENNLGLVHSCAGRFKGRGIEYDDLYASGCIGIVKAYDGFDESRGLCFSTYAVPVILGEIKKLFRDGGSVKVSRSIKELGLKITATRERILKSTGQEPTVSELATILNETPEHIAQAINACMPTISLTPTQDDENSAEYDIPEESCEESLSDLLSLKTVLGTLNSHDRKLIYLRFFKNKTQSETANVLGTTQVQVSRKERKILSQMKKQLSD